MPFAPPNLFILLGGAGFESHSLRQFFSYYRLAVSLKFLSNRRGSGHNRLEGAPNLKRTAWIIRVAKTPQGKWRALKPTWSMRSGKPLLTQRAKYKGAEIETPGGHFEIEWYEGGKRCRKNVGEQPGDAVKALAKQKLKLEAQAAGIAVAEPEKANGKRSLKQAVDEFLAEKRRTKAKKTHQALKQVLEQFLQVCGRPYLEDIKRSDIMDKFVGALQDQELADRTIYHRFACLISFLKANDVKLVTLKDAPDYVEQDIRVYTQSPQPGCSITHDVSCVYTPTCRKLRLADF